ncbi:phage tail protein [Xenorhabdus sp. PR6a]|uniref:phage tail protein n=1 Tax=Xenorhabdus sp. PR6a TaxID=3025877 RepID=UPI00235927FE|nr:phage tail protein [Xenorhabdus sp. PR6a]MDC9583021.1 phage tail protein [Xenorhabdus sp. PR6a]
MSTKFFALLTQLGADKLANAAALGTKIEITHMAVGDGGGSLPTPDTKQTKLINEKRRAAINTLSIDPKNTNQIIAEQVIPENEGGWWIREIGLFDKDGILIAVGNCAETYKPQLQEGSGRTQTIRMILIVSSADAVTLKIDPSVVLATREYVDNSITKHANSRNHPDATLKEKGFVILSSAVDSNSETHAATPKAVKAAYDFANSANNNANGRVPSGRKVNGKALNADISLNAGDVGAYNKDETDARVNEAKAQAKAANDNANGRVPSGRKVNGKALNADISLNAGDVGAYNKGETDERVNARLEKSKNGADIPNKDEFVKNLGLAGTVELAVGALSKYIVREVGNGETLVSCNIPGIYNIAVTNPATVSDFPKVNGNPIYNYGMMIVTVSHSSISQLYMSHRGHIAVRQLWYPSKEYDEWFVQYSSANKPNLEDLGAVSINDAMRLTYLDGWENIYNGYSGFIPKASFLEKYHLPINNYGVQLRFSNVSGASSEGNDQVWSHRLIFIHRGDTYRTDHINKDEIVTRKFWDNMNAKQDTNGFLRISSPIVEIYSDGKFTTNNESEGATVTKLGIGHYKIFGVLGYNADGAWGIHGGISLPKNNNGLELIYIDDHVEKDGTITIKIFHRQHIHLIKDFQNRRIKEVIDDKIFYYLDGESCDIPDGCHLDVRVQMPKDSIWNKKKIELSDIL